MRAPPSSSPIKCGPLPKVRNWRRLKTASLTRAERNMRFVEKHCRIPEGDHVGGAVKLARFQEEFFYAVYDNAVATKRAYLSMARKNAKTATIAFIVLVHLVGPEARLNSRISSGARSRKQAAEVYNYASKMAALSPTLQPIVHPVPSGKRLLGLKMNTEYEALAAEGATAHGGSPVLAILDEVGQVKGPKDDFIEAIVTSQGAYDDALLIAISTQAATDADLFSIWLDDAERSGDPRIVAHVYTAPVEGDLLDQSGWKAANPALGLFRSRADLAEQAERAARMPTEENSFRWLGLNQRVNRFASFIGPTVWRENAGLADLSVFQRRPVFGGLDLSRVTDLTALVLVAEEDGLWHVLPTFWKPEATLRDHGNRDKAPYEMWRQQGMLRAVPGPVIEYSYVARDIETIVRGMDVRQINFDSWKMELLVPQLEAIGVSLPLEPFRQGVKSMTPALDATEEEFLHRRMRTGVEMDVAGKRQIVGHPVLAMCSANAVIVPDPAENRKLDKSKSTGRIDGMVALVMAMAAAKSGAAEENIDSWLASIAA